MEELRIEDANIMWGLRVSDPPLQGSTHQGLANISVGLGISINLHGFQLTWQNLTAAYPTEPFLVDPGNPGKWRFILIGTSSLKMISLVLGEDKHPNIYTNTSHVLKTGALFHFSLSTPSHQPLTLTPRWLSGESPLLYIYIYIYIGGDTSSFIASFFYCHSFVFGVETLKINFTLDQVFLEDRPRGSACAFYVACLIAALEHLHERCIVHRSLVETLKRA